MARRATRTLLIDNYDSYTYNLFQLLAEVNAGEGGGSSGHGDAHIGCCGDGVVARRPRCVHACTHPDACTRCSRAHRVRQRPQTLRENPGIFFLGTRKSLTRRER